MPRINPRHSLLRSASFAGRQVTFRLRDASCLTRACRCRGVAASAAAGYL